METGDNPRIHSVKLDNLTEENAEGSWAKLLGKVFRMVCTDRQIMAGWGNWGKPPHRLSRAVPTSCTHFLPINLVPDRGDLLANHEIKLDRFLDFFYRMNRGCMVFAPKLGSDLRKTEMKLTPQKIHRYLARYDDMLVALGTGDISGIYLKVLCRLVDDLFGGDMMGPSLAHITDKSTRRLDIRLDPSHFAECKQLIKGAFELADIRFDVFGQILDGLLVEIDT